MTCDSVEKYNNATMGEKKMTKSFLTNPGIDEIEVIFLLVTTYP